MNGPVLNTDRELYRENTDDPAGGYYENSLHVTVNGAIGMNVGGTVIVQPIADWHRQALAAHHRDLGIPAAPTTIDRIDRTLCSDAEFTARLDAINAADDAPEALIERMARAIAASDYESYGELPWDELEEHERHDYRRHATAALRVVTAPTDGVA